MSSFFANNNNNNLIVSSLAPTNSTTLTAVSTLEKGLFYRWYASILTTNASAVFSIFINGDTNLSNYRRGLGQSLAVSFFGAEANNVFVTAPDVNDLSFLEGSIHIGDNNRVTLSMQEVRVEATAGGRCGIQTLLV